MNSVVCWRMRNLAFVSDNVSDEYSHRCVCHVLISIFVLVQPYFVEQQLPCSKVSALRMNYAEILLFSHRRELRDLSTSENL